MSRRLRVAAQFWALLAQEIEIRTRVAGIDLSEVEAETPRRRQQERAKRRIAFERSPEWMELRQRVLDTHPPYCRRCGAFHGLQVDHIKPKSKFPELALDYANMQVLCWPCNKTKAANL